MTGRNPAPQNRSGATFVELMIATVILALIALASSAYLYHARAETLTQRNKRVALEEINQRLEDLRRAAYEEIRPLTQDYNLHYLEWQGGFWVHSGVDPGETIGLHGLTLPLTTTVQYMDIDGPPDSYDYVHVRVDAGYRVGRTETVSLETFFAP